MTEIMRKCFSTMDKRYLVREYVVSSLFGGIILYAVFGRIQNVALTVDLALRLLYIVGGVVFFPIAKFLYDKIATFIVGDSLIEKGIVASIAFRIVSTSVCFVLWLPMSVVGFAWLYFFGANSARRHGAADSSLQLPEQKVASPRYSFDDVDGMDELKVKLMDQAQAILTEKKNGILFHGDPGNGKTFIAEAFAGEFQKTSEKKVAFLSVSMADMASRWINQSTEQVLAVFEQARQAAKCGACVLFIDEIDSLLVDRSSVSRGDSEVTQQVNAMLTLLIKYRDFAQNGIVIVAATNHLDRLDGAAIREGRFDFKTEISTPDEAARIGLMLRSASKAKLTLDVAKSAAGRWEGFSVARIKHVAELASKNVAKEGRSEVGFDDLMAALREAQGAKGAAFPENSPSLDELSFDSDMSDELKRLARRMIEIEKIESMGGTVPKGILFYGPPGTGKTAVAKALAKSSGWAFLPTTGQKLMSDEKELDRLIEKASSLRPAIVFIDEADDILGNRELASAYAKSATNNLLALIDGNKPLKDVMFIAATNFENALDAAATRGGRFAEKFEFKKPSEDALLAIVRAFMQSKDQAPWDASLTPEAAAELLGGLAPADAKDRLQKAINRVVSKLDDSRITIDDLAAVV